MAFRELRKLVGKCFKKIPLCEAEGIDENSPLMRYIKRWIFIEEQKRRNRDFHNKKCEHISLTANKVTNFKSIHKSSHEMFRTLSKTAERMPPPQLVSKKIKRISPELLDLLTNRHRRRSHLTRRTNGFKNTNYELTRRKYLGELDPTLATYLRSEMDAGGMINEIYGINYYDESLADNGSNDIMEFMNLETVIKLLQLIQQQVSLTREQQEFLNRFILALTELNAEQLATYLAILRARNVLTPDVMHFLHKVLLSSAATIDSAHLAMILNAFQIVTEAALRTIKKTAHDSRRNSMAKESFIMRQMSHVNFSELDTFQDDDVEIPRRTHPTIMFETPPRVHGRPRHHHIMRDTAGFYPPIEMPLPWEDYDHGFKRALFNRMSTIYRSSLHIKPEDVSKRLERSYSEWKREKRAERYLTKRRRSGSIVKAMVLFQRPSYSDTRSRRSSAHRKLNLQYLRN